MTKREILPKVPSPKHREALAIHAEAIVPLFLPFVLVINSQSLTNHSTLASTYSTELTSVLSVLHS